MNSTVILIFAPILLIAVIATAFLVANLSERKKQRVNYAAKLKKVQDG